MQLSLPGAAYIYNGDELGLANVDLPDEALQDPTWERSGHTERGRDGERVPLPWSGDAPPFGFTTGGDDLAADAGGVGRADGRARRRPTRRRRCRCTGGRFAARASGPDLHGEAVRVGCGADATAWRSAGVSVMRAAERRAEVR